MGITISVYRNAEFQGEDFTNGGLSSKVTQLTVMNVPGPFYPGTAAPPVIIENHVPGCLRIVPAEEVNGVWRAKPGWYMAGGNYGGTSDSRFTEKAENLLGHRFYGLVSIHDRQE